MSQELAFVLHSCNVIEYSRKESSPHKFKLRYAKKIVVACQFATSDIHFTASNIYHKSIIIKQCKYAPKVG